MLGIAGGDRAWLEEQKVLGIAGGDRAWLGECCRVLQVSVCTCMMPLG